MGIIINTRTVKTGKNGIIKEMYPKERKKIDGRVILYMDKNLEGITKLVEHIKH